MALIFTSFSHLFEIVEVAIEWDRDAYRIEEDLQLLEVVDAYRFSTHQTRTLPIPPSSEGISFVRCFAFNLRVCCLLSLLDCICSFVLSRMRSHAFAYFYNHFISFGLFSRFCGCLFIHITRQQKIYGRHLDLYFLHLTTKIYHYSHSTYQSE